MKYFGLQTYIRQCCNDSNAEFASKWGVHRQNVNKMLDAKYPWVVIRFDGLDELVQVKKSISS